MKYRNKQGGVFALSLIAAALSQSVYAQEAPVAEVAPAAAAPAAPVAQTAPAPADSALEEVVVTAPRMQEPLKVVTNPRAPRQPIPAHDGADYLKTIPGFSVITKGGTDGDPVFRGMAASRVNILVDNQTVLGGCNGRMDAPTAYIFPEVFNKLTVIKGPQTVSHGPGNSAATVMFERQQPRFSEFGYKMHTGVMVGSANRHDEVVDAQVGGAGGYVQAIATNSQAGDYKDGKNNRVHSAYHRYSANAAVGLTPDADTRIELSAATSDGRAAYADRSMDGTKFLRNNVALSFNRKHLSPLVEEVDAVVAANNVDHIMDDQTLRTPGMMGFANLKRDTSDLRASTKLRVADPTLLTIGVDAQRNNHKSRSAMPGMPYSAWQNDASIAQQGLFTELDHHLSEQQKVVAGYRADWWKAQDNRPAMIMDWNAMGMGGMMGAMAMNPTSGKQRTQTLHSGFARYEQRLSEPTTLFVGLGHTSRFPDYWELIAKQSTNSVSSFNVRPEKTNQLDTGVIYKTAETEFNLSAFYSKVTDFILIDSTMKMVTGAARNVNATTFGGEAGFAQALNSDWKLHSSLAYVHGTNNTDGTPLAQLPPLEGLMSLGYDDKTWSFTALTRVVAAQTRFDKNKGNIVGKDIGASSGFAVFSMNAGWRPSKSSLITAGVDNLFNRTYAEFISRAGTAITGYTQTTRVNQPGRTLWLKATLDL
jgi:iron complex outermembrane receptor protein